MEGTRKGNTYVVDLNFVPRNNLTCLSVIDDDRLLWHMRLRHASFSLLDKLRSKDLVLGLPSIKLHIDVFVMLVLMESMLDPLLNQRML